MNKELGTKNFTDILILGAGLGGYETFRTTARELKKFGIEKKITLVNDTNYFGFVPMYHEVASGAIEPVHCTLPLREVVHGTPHAFIKATVTQILPDQKIVKTSVGDISYEYCVVALGSRVNFFNIPGATEHCYTVRDLPSAIKLQEDVIEQLEGCETRIDMVIVGGGPTGVEMAGQFIDFVRHDIRKLYPEKTVTVSLIDGNTTLVPRLPKKVQDVAGKRLTTRGVQLILGSGVAEVKENEVVLKNGTHVPSTLTIWTAGFQNIADHFLPGPCTEGCRIPVTDSLHIGMYPTIYAIGDIALAKNSPTDQPHPQLGEVAHKHGEYVGKHIVAMVRGKTMPPFHYRSIGTLMPLGEWYGVAIIGPFIFFGRLAWWLRRTVYVLFMPGIIRKLRIILDWTLHAFGFRYTVDLDEERVRKVQSQ